MWWATFWSLGCSGGPSTIPTSTPDPHTDGAHTADTGAIDTGSPPPPPLAGHCSLSDNVLRASCTIEVDPPQPVEVVFRPEDGRLPERVHGSPEALALHQVGLHFMRPETPYRYTIRALDSGEELQGTFTTGVLPAPAAATLSVTGVSTSPMVGMASPCGAYGVIFNTRGDLLWYEDLSQGTHSFLEGVSFTEDQTIIGLANGDLLEVDLRGQRGLELSLGEDFSDRIHHDVFRRDGLTYVLFQETTDDGLYLLDGFYVFDDTGAQIAEWRLSDHHVPVPSFSPPNPVDYSHANAIWVDAQGDVLVSLRHLSAFVKVAGLQRVDFGALRWTMTGDPLSPMVSDFVLDDLTGGLEGFIRQHNVHVLEDGRYAMFDNRALFTERSRLLLLEVDEPGRVATITEAYDLNLHCDFQGGAWHTIAGNPMATCAPLHEAFEFAAGSASDGSAPESPLWEGEVRCEQGTSPYTPRFVPLDW